MRQRISTKAPPRRDGSAAWEAASSEDDEGDSVHQAIPMHNPLHYQDQRTHVPAPPGSFPLSWHQHQYAQPSHDLRKPPRTLSASDLPSLTPVFIPDSSYQTYLRTGRTVFRKQQPKTCTRICCAKFCAVFSFVAVSFLLFVGLVFDSQPLYIPGSLPKHVQYVEGSSSKTQTYYSITPSIRLLPASNAYRAAWGYLLTGCLSLAYAYNAHYWIQLRWWKRYQDIPDADSTVANFEPSSNDIEGGSSPNRRRAYHQHQGGSIMGRLVEVFNLARIYIVSTWWPKSKKRRRRRRREAGPKEV